MSTRYQPEYEQFVEVKKRYPDYLLAFRTGDVYEFYGTDARTVADVLDQPLGRREMEIDGEQAPILTATIRCDDADAQFVALLEADHVLAVCEQIGQPNG